MPKVNMPANDSDRGRIYLAALEADVPVTPLFLAAQSRVNPNSMGRHIQRLLESGMLLEVGRIRVPVIPGVHLRTREHCLYVASHNGICRNEMSNYAPELYHELLMESSELADCGERRLLLGVLRRAAHDSLTQRNLSYFRVGDGFLEICDLLQLDADWACQKWRKLYSTVIEDAKTAA
jgi:hypothetical protein